jgi:hypothetical protein
LHDLRFADENYRHSGEHPTDEEKRALDERAKAELGEYEVKLIKAYDPQQRKTIYRLDAIQRA